MAEWSFLLSNSLIPVLRKKLHACMIVCTRKDSPGGRNCITLKFWSLDHMMPSAGHIPVAGKSF